MEKHQEKRVLNTMKQHLVDGEYIDDAGEVELTQLAEDAAATFGLYDGDDIPEEVFELAYQAGEWYEHSIK